MNNLSRIHKKVNLSMETINVACKLITSCNYDSVKDIRDMMFNIQNALGYNHKIKELILNLF